MFDTHCHLNFKAFKKTLPDIIQRAKDGGITHIVIPGTDIPTSQKAVEIAQEHENMYAAVGIHPHHVYKYLHQEAINPSQTEILNPSTAGKQVQDDMIDLEQLLQQRKVVAIGEIGMDRHLYGATKYDQYAVDEKFITLQAELLRKQIQLALNYDKSVILHNREAKADLLPIVSEMWDSKLEGRVVFHCCEPDEELFTFAKEHNMFIGVDGDITYYPEKQEFIKNLPLEMLVLETDAPFLLPEPLKSQKKYPNEPFNMNLTAEFIAKLKGISKEELVKITTGNAKKLFNIR